SIHPAALFAKSLELNEGDVYDALLTNHELLRNEARFFAKFISYGSNYDSMTAFYNKFVDLRGDLQERGPLYNGDHPGTWSRMWGMMLYYLDRSPIDKPNISGGNVRFQVARAKAAAVAEAAEVVKLFILWPESDLRKSEINRKGSEAMYHA